MINSFKDYKVCSIIWHMANNEQEKKQQILKVTKTDQRKTVDELFAKSKPSSSYYTFLILATVIVAAGLLLENAFIVIGGMLVAPVLTPIFVTALGFAVGQGGPIKNASSLLIKSFFIVVLGSFILALIFGIREIGHAFENTTRTAMLYFLVAVAAGMAATFAWVKKENAEVLPGVAIAVSLVPPLSLVGIRLAAFDISLARYYFVIFLFNLFGMLVGSLIAFTLLKFYKSEKDVKREVKELEDETEKKKEENLKKKIVEIK